MLGCEMGQNGRYGLGSDICQEDEDLCAMCYEELALGTTQTLECAHKFHDEVVLCGCVRWVRAEGSGGGGQGLGSDMCQEDEDMCAMCHEELTLGTTQTLKCAHKFHDEVVLCACVRWVRAEGSGIGLRNVPGRWRPVCYVS